MRKGEKGKVKIHKSYGWASTIDTELLRTPKSCESAERMEKLRTKGIIYEITLHDWEIRDDIDEDGLVEKFVE